VVAAEGEFIQSEFGRCKRLASFFPGEIQIPLTLVGGAARGALGLPAGEVGKGMFSGSVGGRVLAVFRRTFYLEMPGGLVCVGSRAIGAGPLNALYTLPGDVDWEASGLSSEDRIRIRGNFICVGKFSFLLTGSKPWRPQRLPKGWRLENFIDALFELANEAGRRGPGEGFAPLLFPSKANSLKKNGGRTFKDPFLRAGSRAAFALIGWLSDAARLSAGGAGSAPPDEAVELIGLGSGLTPAGDDFIGGAMIALRALGRERLADRLAEWALPLAKSNTGRISQAHLACAAAGEGAVALHEIIRAMSLPNRGNLSRCLDAIDTIGHTSGWDILAGAAGAISAMFTRSSCKTG